MSLTLEELRAIEAYDGTVTRVPTGASSIPLPYWDGKRLQSGESYEDMRRRMASATTRAAKASMIRSKQAARDRDAAMQAELPREFTTFDVARVGNLKIETAAAYTKRRVKAGKARRVGTAPHPDGHLTRVAVYSWEAQA